MVNRLTAVIKPLSALLRPDLIVFLAGLCLLAYGLWLAWPPLGFVGPGLVLMGISLFGERKV